MSCKLDFILFNNQYVYCTEGHKETSKTGKNVLSTTGGICGTLIVTQF